MISRRPTNEEVLMMLNLGMFPFQQQPVFTPHPPVSYQVSPSLMDGVGITGGFTPQSQPILIGSPNPQAFRPRLNTVSAETEAQAAADQPTTEKVIGNAAADYMIATGNPWTAGIGILLKGLMGGK